MGRECESCNEGAQGNCPATHMQQVTSCSRDQGSHPWEGWRVRTFRWRGAVSTREREHDVASVSRCMLVVLVRIRGRKGQKRSPTCLGQEGGFGARGLCRLNRQAMDKPLEHQETWAPKPSRGFLIFLCVRFILSHVKLSSSV